MTTMSISKKEEFSLEKLDTLNQQRKGEIAKEKAKHEQKRKDIMKLHLVDGVSMIQIGKRYGISRQRIHQIINNYN